MTRRLNAWITGAMLWVLQPLLVLIVLAAGAWASVQMTSNPSGPTRTAEDASEYRPLVETVTVQAEDAPVRIVGFGSLQARYRVSVTPQVGGKVMRIHPQLRAGGGGAQGGVLVEIDQRDYELALQRAEADVVLRKKDLEIELAEGRAAREEWAQLNPGEDVPPLVAREPQIAAARGALRSAEAQVTQAELDLERTIIAAPFDGRVTSSTVEAGQVIATNSTIAEIYDTSVFEVPVPIETDDLVWITLPSTSGASGVETPITLATVHIDVGGLRDSVKGQVVRLEGEIDSSTRLVNVVVSIDTADLSPRARMLAMPGLYVEVELHGPTLPDVVRLDRAMMRDNGQVWIVDADRLVLTQPEVVYADNTCLLVRGLGHESRIVTSSLEIVTSGMLVRIASTNAGSAEEPDRIVEAGDRITPVSAAGDRDANP